MQQLHIHTAEELQGKFIAKKLNLLLIFQVNCPGCFLYALPIYKSLFDKYSDDLGFLAIATAFEDFKLNTLENTLLLIEKRETVAETKKALSNQGIDKFPLSLDFPIAMDAKMSLSDKERVIQNICLLNPNYKIWADYDKNLMRKKVENYLDNQKEVSVTFTSNGFRGTPTFVLFNGQNEILDSWFGHTSPKSILNKIEHFLN